jgi:hypothetical protein
MRPDHRHSSGRRTPPPIPARRLITAPRDSPFARSSDPAGRRQHCGASRSRLNRLSLRPSHLRGHCSSGPGGPNSAWCQRDTGADEVSNQDRLERPLAAASRRLNSDLTRPRGKLGRPRKTVEARPDALRTRRNPQLARAPESLENGQTPAAPHYEADGSRLIGVRDAGAFLGVSPWTVRDLIRAGHLPRVVLPLGGRKVLVRLADLVALVNRSLR